ncbi:hypothetical protein [Hymenobacter weizhouensis]|uniref:hypothetical protein n=1 Tax=Hymenobacter sp. YIM 151500-1 TaxID=2987689 RepID=UPI00222634E4|nr:hypothetical protein [Hymenobacter sp. YIM 151500-1]UYZ64214.1 hypothetical protein OIS53_05045 [Hymenobacter sp. YIM 151500-1]
MTELAPDIPEVPEGYADGAPEPLPPPEPEQFAELRSEDGRVVLGNNVLEIEGQRFAWRELAGADVQPVRWLLWFLLGGLTLAGFTLGYLQFWLRTMPAALGMAAGALLLAWGLRGTNRWRLHRSGRETLFFSLPGPARSWQQLAQEVNRRIRQRHDEAAAAADYWLQLTARTSPGPTGGALPIS